MKADSLWLACAAAAVCTNAQADPAPAPPPRPPPISHGETFGYGHFEATYEQLEQGEKSQVASVEQGKILNGLVSLMRSRKGYHTPKEVDKAFHVKLKLTRKADRPGGTADWNAELPGANISLLASGPESKLFGQSSTLAIIFDNALNRPDCISPLKAFFEIQRAGGAGYMQLDRWRRFRFDGGEEAAFTSRDLSEQTCVSQIILIGRVKPGAGAF